MNSQNFNFTKDEQVNIRLRRLYEQYGYKKYRMNKFEEYSFYINNKNFLESDRVITFTDLDGKLIALKPDVTLSIAKNSKATAQCSERLYYNENVFRVNGMEFKELNQTWVEFIGHIDFYNTLEVINLALSSLEIISDSYILSLSHMGFISSLLDSADIGYKCKQKIIECIKQKRSHDLDSIAQQYGISDEFINRLKSVISINGDLVNSIDAASALAVTDKEKDAINELKMLCDVFSGTPAEDHIRLDFSTVSNTDYYNGIMFDGFVEGVSKAVINGGRYDYLIQKMGRKDLEAMGFAVNFYQLDRFFKPTDCAEKFTLITYNDNTDTKELFKTVKALEKEGKKVLVEKTIPNHVEFCEIINL